MAQYRCKVCEEKGKIRDFDDGRKFNMHLIRFHPEEYEKAGHKKEKLNSAAVDHRPAAERKKEKPEDRPAGFRILNKKNEDEARALAAGFLFIDDTEELYRVDDARAAGLI